MPPVFSGLAMQSRIDSLVRRISRAGTRPRPPLHGRSRWEMTALMQSASLRRSIACSSTRPNETSRFTVFGASGVWTVDITR